MVTLADAILQEDTESVRLLLRYGEDINQIDEYGFTPLIEAAIIDNKNLSELLIKQGADPNLQDATGGTALHWSSENNNKELIKLLLKAGANPNAYTLAGQPVLVIPMLRRQTEIKQLLIKAGADQTFAQDYINAKLLGHMFELVGTDVIISPTNQFVEVDYEGFYLEFSLNLIADSLAQFCNHFAARQLRRYLGLGQFIVNVIERAAELIRYQQYRVDINKHKERIETLLQHEPLIIPVGYEGHAITFIRHGNIWVKCDRREDSRLYDNIMFYYIDRPDRLTTQFLSDLIYKKQTYEYINAELDQMLQLSPITELKVDAQVSGNCSWANVEATIPALFFLMMMQVKSDEAEARAKTLALNFFHRWREWNKDRSLQYCIQSFQEGDTLRKASKAEILAAILFQCSDPQNPNDQIRIKAILEILLNSPYEYLLKNYLRVYYYEGMTDEGKKFADLLKNYNYKV